MARQAGRGALLEGEDPDTEFAEDARHWIAIYRELIAFRSKVLARVLAQAHSAKVHTRSDGMREDVLVIEKQLARYRGRLEFWYEKQWELEGLSVDGDSRTITYRDSSEILTNREYQLFSALANRTGYTKASRLLVDAWHDAGLPEETLRTYIVRLRAKLERLGNPARIVNRPRRGYALVFGAPEITEVISLARR